MKITLIADIHANIEAMDAVLADVRSRRINDIYCAGDVVGYGGAPRECYERLRRDGIPTTRGNHEQRVWEINSNRNECDFNASFVHMWKATGELLGEEAVLSLFGAPAIMDISRGGRRMYIVHGTPFGPVRDYMHHYPMFWQTVQEGFLEEAGRPEILVMGHSHRPFVARCDGSVIVNPGSVGQPRDGNHKASYAVIDTETLCAEIVRVPYDVAKAADRIMRMGFDPFFAERLGD